MSLFNQSYTNIASQFGMPLFGVGGLAFTGNYFWVDETNGSDGSTGGPQDPFKTLSAAHSACVANNNDVVFFTGTMHTTATLTWSKDKTHLIGLCAPSDNDRARISQTGTTVFTPLVNVTASGCIFRNLGTFHGFASATAQVCWAEAGGRNYYENVQFLGMGNLTAAAHAGGRSLTVAGSGENLFRECTIGLDTVVRATGTNTSLEFLTATPRNILRSCVFQADVTNAADTHIAVGVGGIDRYVLLDNCTFLNAVNGGPAATAMTAALSVNASAGGQVLLQNCASLGATKLSAAGPVYVMGAVPTGATSGLAVAAS